jgi:dTDP-4-amino-4,6-dideoxygalactose transaminase
MIKFLDLKSINQRYRKELIESMTNVLDSGFYIGGDYTDSFEQSFADYSGTKFAIGVGNGLDALTLTLQAWKELGLLRNGDEVIVPGNTFIATVLAVMNQNLKPVLVDPDSITHNVSPDKLKKIITPKTRAIIPVHLYGRLAPMNEICAIADEFDLLVLEDCAQAHGASINKKVSGSWGDAGGFSFYPGKNLGALGDAGIVTTDDKNLDSMIRKIQNYGFSKRYVSEVRGTNSRLDPLQAAVLSVKLKYLEYDILRRREIAQIYFENISNPCVRLPLNTDIDSNVWHLFVIETKDRDALQNFLAKNEIETLIHYPIPPHLQVGLSGFISGDLPVTESLSKRVLSLPMDPTMSNESVNRICDAVNRFEG